MKPDWCDEATLEKARALNEAVFRNSFTVAAAEEHFARAILAAKEEGMEEAAKIAHDAPDANNDLRGPLYATGWTSACRAIESTIRSRAAAIHRAAEAPIPERKSP